MLISAAQVRLSTIQATVTSLLMSYASFFALGNSNAISSIDLSNAYNGVSGYNVGAVGILVFFSNWAGPIWWSSAGILMLAHIVDPAPPATENDLKSRKWVEEERKLLSQAIAKGQPRKAGKDSSAS